MQYKDTTEAAVAGVGLIAASCIRSQTVKRLIYTASITASSQLIEGGNGLWSCVDESCWTPLDHPFTCGTDFTLVIILILDLNFYKISPIISRINTIFSRILII